MNPSKCEFSQSSLKFLGHVINKAGISADPEKVRAVTEMPAPTNVGELRRLMGMINQLGKFVPNCAEICHPMTALLSKKNAWVWGPSQETEFSTITLQLTSNPRVLPYTTPLLIPNYQ